MDVLFALPLRPLLRAISGDQEGAAKDLTRMAGVVIGGIAGFALGGPVGAYAGGVTGGVAADGIISSVDTERNGVFSPSGTIKNVHDIISGKSGNVVEDVVTLGQVLVADGLMGNSYGCLAGDKLKICTSAPKNRIKPYGNAARTKPNGKKLGSIKGKCKAPQTSLDEFKELAGYASKNVSCKPSTNPQNRLTFIPRDHHRAANM